MLLNQRLLLNFHLRQLAHQQFLTQLISPSLRVFLCLLGHTFFLGYPAALLATLWSPSQGPHLATSKYWNKPGLWPPALLSSSLLSDLIQVHGSRYYQHVDNSCICISHSGTLSSTPNLYIQLAIPYLNA